MRVAALWAGLLLILLSSLIAPGTMPARAGNGAVVLVICSGDGVAEMAFDPVTMEPVSDREDGGKDKTRPGYCPWAASQSVVDFVPPTVVARPSLFARHLAWPATETVLAVSRATGLPPSTGPPSAV